ncbi:MAG: AsmA family protein [Bacteroidaceae bacterium]|nr:AsmA family protein [Bacteroidaceae bacterium]
MKKALKITGIALASLVGLVLLIILIACWLIFTPARLTSIVDKVADKFITCDTHIGRVNLTLFKTFPQLGLDVNDVVLINPTEGAKTDTVAALGHLTLAVDAKAFLRDRSIIVRGLDIADGTAYLYTSETGVSNLDIFPKSDKEKKESSFDLSSLDVDIDHITVSRLSATLDNRKAGLNTGVDGFDLKLKGTLKEGNIDAALDAALRSAILKIAGEKPIGGTLSQLGLKADIKYASQQSGNADITLTAGPTAFTQGDMNALLDKLTVKVAGDLSGTKSWHGAVELAATTPALTLGGEKPMAVDADELQVKFLSSFDGTNYSLIPASVALTSSNLTMDKDKLLDKAQVALRADVAADTTFSRITIGGGVISLNQFDINLNGTVLRPDSTTLDADIALNTNRWNLKEVLAVVPKAYRKKLSNIRINDGALQLDAKANAGLKDGKLAISTANAGVTFDRLNGRLNDSISVVAPKLTASVAIPAKKTTSQFKEFAGGTLNASSLAVNIKDNLQSSILNLKSTFSLSDFTDKKTPFSAKAKLVMDNLAATLDTIDAKMAKPVVEAMMITPKGKNPKPHYEATVTTSSLDGRLGRLLAANTGALTIKAAATRDATKKAVLDQWNPKVNASLSTAHADYAQLPVPVDIPSLRFDFTPGKFTIDDSRIKLGKSDFSLRGDITNLDAWLAKDGLLKGNLTFSSDYTDVSQIMDLVSGLGAKDSTATADANKPQAAFADDEVKEDNPFMVPLGVDVFFRTDVKTANWNGFDFHNVGGKITCRDGVLVMEELGFTSKAATMQLTAMYKSPRKNHLFAGVDFHLINIEIDDLIRMIPKVDSIVPMLKSFDGQAQFHFAGESYLKSNYDFKLSTLRGAAAIEGKDLVVLPSSTFDTIKKYLMTDKSTENRIDSLDVELSVFKDEVDLYPFRVRLGQYEAIVAGRHNINRDFDFNYHLSVTDAPVPVRLGLDVSGTLDDMHFKLAPCRYNNLYKPERRNGIQERTLQLKTLINESLKRNVKPVEYYD